MVVTSDENALFSIDSAVCNVLGFHATSSFASLGIEQRGFLPNKILDLADHERLLELGSTYGADTSYYRDWLGLYSVTFAKSSAEAIRHIRSGFAGGQGLKNVSDVAEKIYAHLDVADMEFVSGIQRKIEVAKFASPVVYAVCLSGLGPRLDPDKTQNIYHYRWNPDAPLPEISEISPTRILVKLEMSS